MAKQKSAPKVTKPKAPTSKAATKPKTAKKVLVDHDDNADDLDVDDDISDVDTSSKKGAPSKKKSASETYTKVCVSNFITQYLT